MNSRKMKFIGLFFVVLAFGCPGNASALTFDQNVTPDAIFGSGNANGSFTVDRDNGIELGLRGKLRHNASGNPENTFNSNGDGTYSFETGVAPTQSFPVGVWSFEWSINTDYDGNSGLNLNDLTYALGYDSDPSTGTVFSMFDPINLEFADHAIGDNSTGNGGGAVAGDSADYSNLIAGNNVAQNSWKAHWFLDSFDPTLDGTYDFYLEAFENENSLARTEMQVIVGQGGAAPIPEPTTWILFGMGFLGIGLLGRKKNLQK